MIINYTQWGINDNIILTQHAIKRIKQRGITHNQFNNIINKGAIYQPTSKLRGDKYKGENMYLCVKGKFMLPFVIEFGKVKVLTLYRGKKHRNKLKYYHKL